jgi:DNA adenine methylase
MLLEKYYDGIPESSQSSLILPGFEAEQIAPNAKPFLRWVGGKSRLLSSILPYVPEKMNSYHEPFLGSGAMFFAVRNRAKKSFLSDLNAELVNAWTVVRDEPTAFFKKLRDYELRQGEEAYYQVRAEAHENHIDRAARFFYLNQTAWNGLWRENRFGVFNVPFGARAFRGIKDDFLVSVSAALQNVSIELTDFREVASRANEGDFCYFDPPYLPISDTSKFSGYNGKRFRFDDLVELSEVCKDLSQRKVSWIVSNRDNEVMRELFSHARVISFTTRRSVAAQSKRHVQPKDSPEVIIVGGPNS